MDYGILFQVCMCVAAGLTVGTLAVLAATAIGCVLGVMGCRVLGRLSPARWRN